MQKMEEDQKARQLEDAANKLTEMKVEGWLFKKGSFVKSWKRRYFLVQNGCLVYLTDAKGWRAICYIFCSVLPLLKCFF